jgi:hypothetical protein
MNATIIPAEKPYVPENGDLVCDFMRMEEQDPKPSRFLESKQKKLLKKLSHEDINLQLLPLQMVHPNPWIALKLLRIDASDIKTATYKCPYTDYLHYSIVPVTLISHDLAKNYANVRHWNKDYLFDHTFTKHMFGSSILRIGAIGKMLLGSGWTLGTSVNDGSRGEISATIALNNGDKLFVQTWEWYNK